MAFINPHNPSGANAGSSSGDIPPNNEVNSPAAAQNNAGLAQAAAGNASSSAGSPNHASNSLQQRGNFLARMARDTRRPHFDAPPSSDPALEEVMPRHGAQTANTSQATDGDRAAQIAAGLGIDISSPEHRPSLDHVRQFLGRLVDHPQREQAADSVRVAQLAATLGIARLPAEQQRALETVSQRVHQLPNYLRRGALSPCKHPPVMRHWEQTRYRRKSGPAGCHHLRAGSRR